MNNYIYGTITNGSVITPTIPVVSGGWTLNLYSYNVNNKVIASSVNGIVGSATVTGFYTTPTVSSYTKAIMFNGNGTIITPNNLTVQLLMVGGGGGGGGTLSGNLNSASGGGGGGVAAGSITLSANTLYTITVGAGGECFVDGSFTSISGSRFY